MKTNSYCIIFSVFMVSAASAQSSLKEEDLAQVFAKSAVEEQQEGLFNYWTGGLQQPAGGMVIRFRYDVTGDGKDDWLYKSSIATHYDWTLYVAEGDTYRKADKFYSHTRPHVREERGVKILTTTQEEGVSFLGVIQCRVSKTGVVQKEKFKVEGLQKVQEITSVEGWAEKAYGSIEEFKGGEATSLQNVLLDDSPRWREVALTDPLNSLHTGLEPSDEAELFGREFTPATALAAIKTQEELRNQRRDDSGIKAVSAATKVYGANAAPHETAATAERSGNWTLVAGAIAAILTSLALLYFVVKQRGKQPR